MNSVAGGAVSVGWEASADFVVVGGGVAGLTAAAVASARGLRVLTVSKGGPEDTATQYAQGGIAVVGMGSAESGDSIASHVRDTCDAGAGLCDEDAVRSIVAGGRTAILQLERLGAVFDRGPDGTVSRTREGGHSVRRIIHSGGDATGAEVQRALNASGHAVSFGTAAVRVLTDHGSVVGVLVQSADGYGVVHAPAVLLATGGLGQLYSCSTNPPGATADGIALALDAGAAVSDLEFVQFHPTVLFAAGSSGRRPLISEAVRGEGAHLVDLDGIRFMTGVHPLGDLAPRDVVSRAIAQRCADTGTDHVMLDATAVENFARRFPTVSASCRAVGIDPTRELIPVAPAAHYSCGGVNSDTSGRTRVAGLFAAGEVARTGLHGANRLASNSLLEGLVVGERVGIAAAERRGTVGDVRDVTLPLVGSLDRSLLQSVMTAHVGVVRDGVGLAAAGVALGAAAVARPGSIHSLEDAALTVAASAIVLAASAREESRGCHTRRDFPESVEAFRSSVSVRRGESGALQLDRNSVMMGAV